MACKKDDAAPDYSSAIIGKWTFVNQIALFTPTVGAAFRDTLTYNNGSYYNFLSANKMVYYVNDNTGGIYSDSVTYHLNGNQLYAAYYTGEKDATTIASISSTNLTIYKVDKSDPTVVRQV